MNTNKYFYFKNVAFIALICASSASYAMNEDDNASTYPTIHAQVSVSQGITVKDPIDVTVQGNFSFFSEDEISLQPLFNLTKEKLSELENKMTSVMNIATSLNKIKREQFELAETKRINQEQKVLFEERMKNEQSEREMISMQQQREFEKKQMRQDIEYKEERERRQRQYAVEMEKQKYVLESQNLQLQNDRIEISQKNNSAKNGVVPGLVKYCLTGDAKNGVDPEAIKNDFYQRDKSLSK